MAVGVGGGGCMTTGEWFHRGHVGVTVAVLVGVLALCVDEEFAPLVQVQ